MCGLLNHKLQTGHLLYPRMVRKKMCSGLKNTAKIRHSLVFQSTSNKPANPTATMRLSDPHCPALTRLWWMLLGCLAVGVTQAESVRWQKHEDLEQQAQHHLMAQLPPNTKVRIHPLEKQLQLQACTQPEFFIPSTTGALRGQIRIGARCTHPQNWTVYLGVNIQEAKTYYVTNTALEAGHLLTETDLNTLQGWSDELPSGVVFDGESWLGQRLTQNIPAGTPLQRQWLRIDYVINTGQSVKIRAQTPQFQISSEGKALNRAAVGQNVQVRTPSGQVVGGKAQLGGWVEVAF